MELGDRPPGTVTHTLANLPESRVRKFKVNKTPEQTSSDNPYHSPLSRAMHSSPSRGTRFIWCIATLGFHSPYSEKVPKMFSFGSQTSGTFTKHFVFSRQDLYVQRADGKWLVRSYWPGPKTRLWSTHRCSKCVRKFTTICKIPSHQESQWVVWEVFPWPNEKFGSIFEHNAHLNSAPVSQSTMYTRISTYHICPPKKTDSHCQKSRYPAPMWRYNVLLLFIKNLTSGYLCWRA